MVGIAQAVDKGELQARRIDRKRRRLGYLAGLLRQGNSRALDQVADLLVTLTDSEINVFVDKLRSWLV